MPWRWPSLLVTVLLPHRERLIVVIFPLMEAQVSLLCTVNCVLSSYHLFGPVSLSPSKPSDTWSISTSWSTNGNQNTSRTDADPDPEVQIFFFLYVNDKKWWILLPDWTFSTHFHHMWYLENCFDQPFWDAVLLPSIITVFLWNSLLFLLVMHPHKDESVPRWNSSELNSE